MSRFLRPETPRTAEDFAEAYRELAELHGLSFDDLRGLRNECIKEVLGGQLSEVIDPMVIFTALEYWLNGKDRDER